MRQTLFYLPHEWLGWPVFGVGWLLVVWLAGAALWIGWTVRRKGWGEDARGQLVSAALVALLIGLVLPRLEVYSPEGPPLGIPIRGYGVMLLAGLLSAVGLSVRRGRKAGMAPETIINLAFAVFVTGLVSARVFYIVQKWDEFRGPTLGATLLDAINFVQGGLVVYGGIFGGMAAFFVYAWRHRLNVLLLGDVITPGFMLGLALGRVGCFLNGCCFGGACELPWAVEFPPQSPPYVRQLELGQLPQGALHSLPTEPTQLYSALNALLICLLAVAYTPYRRRLGEVAALVFTLYGITRFLLEVIRVDELAVLGTGMTVSQNASVLLLVLVAGLWGYIWWALPAAAPKTPGI